MIAKHNEGRWTKLISNWNPATSTKQKGYGKQGRLAKTWEEDINSNLQPTKVHRDYTDLSKDTTWVTTAQDGLKWTPWKATL